MDTEISMSSTKCDQKSKNCASSPLGECEHARGIVDAMASRAIDQHLPRRGARADIMKVGVVHLGDALQEDRVPGIACVERLEDSECFVRLVLVPDVDDVPLEVGFTAEQSAARTCSVDLLQSLHPIASGKPQQPAHNFRGR